MHPDTRTYICKQCGSHTSEPYKEWKKKPMPRKNICPTCLRYRELVSQTNRERTHDVGYGGPYRV